MPRRNNPTRRTPVREPKGADGSTAMPTGERTEAWRGVQYSVRVSRTTGSDVLYRCPGCDQQLTASQPHLLTWPLHDAAAEDRRHWHTACWRARDTRAPGVIRSRNAPRYG